MPKSNNPIRVGSRVKVKHGYVWLRGTVVATVLTRCYIRLDCNDKVIVDNYHDVTPV